VRVKKFTPRQRLFVLEYLKDLNATQAAIRAGYAQRTANKQGPRLLVNAGIKAAIAREQKKREQRIEVTVDKIEQELAIIGFSDLKNYIEIDPDSGAIRAKGFEQMPGRSSRALESIEENRTIRESSDGQDSNVVNDKIKFKLHSKVAALELLGKRHGMFPTKIEGGLEVRAKLSLIDFKKSLKGCQDASGS
jgi:phage terminase small subunit